MPLLVRDATCIRKMAMVEKMNKNILTLALLLVVTAISTTCIIPVAAVSCNSNAECEDTFRLGSRCVENVCTNPFVDGCLKTMLGSLDDDELAERKLAPEVLEAIRGRVCNSDDTDNAVSNANCLENEFDYFEIRVHNADWESSIFVAWIMQIMLMEVLKVPVSIGVNSSVTAISSFYSPTNKLIYSEFVYPWDAFEVGVDCDKTNENCVDVLPEVWNGQSHKWNQMTLDGFIEPVDGCGQVGKLGWFIPGSTARRDNFLVSYYGLQGEKNRAKLAQTFKRPTTWYEYCEEVSENNCTSPDGVAQYYPEDKEQALQYFAEGLYTGYFRMLPENNCTEFPTTCTGYFVSPTCKWDNNVDSQLYWNDIVGLKQDGPLEPNKGYSYFRQIEIWRAANATKSDVMMWWWQPEALVQEFSTTDWNFQEIVLPTVTDVCYRSRIDPDERCSEDVFVRRGNRLGSCENEAHALRKIISSTLQKKTLDDDGPVRSPGYSFIRALKISDIDVQSMLKEWIAIKNDPQGNDAREAVCSWVIENMDTLLGFIPPGHPRKLDETGSFDYGYIYFALVATSLGILGILVTGCIVYQSRLTKVFVYAQVTFIFIILLGFFLVAIGGLFYALEPTDFTCIARSWLTSLGFSIVLAAVLVKMSTINRIMQSSKKLKRVKVSRQSMFGSLSLLVMIDLIFLIAWTVISPMQARKNLVLPEEFSTVVETSTICRSSQGIWQYLLEGWHSLLLLVASVLAFQSRDIIPQFNESRSIGTMIYSQFLFMILRLIVLHLGFSMLIAPNVFGASVSLLYIFDTLLAIAIYVIPKCIEAAKDPDIYDPRSSLTTNSRISYGQPVSNGNYRFSANANSEHSRPQIASSSSDKGRRPFALQSISMEVNCESEATVSNLRGRQSRRRSFDRPSSCEVSTSVNYDSLNDEELSTSNHESLNEVSEQNMEDAPSETYDGLSSSRRDQAKSSIVSNRTPPRTNLSSHGVQTEGDGKEIVASLQSKTNGNDREGISKLKSQSPVAKKNNNNGDCADPLPHNETATGDNRATRHSDRLPSSSQSHIGSMTINLQPKIENEQNMAIPDNTATANSNVLSSSPHSDRVSETINPQPKIENEQNITTRDNTATLHSDILSSSSHSHTGNETINSQPKIDNEKNKTTQEKEENVEKLGATIPDQPILCFTTSTSRFPLVEKRALKEQPKANDESTLVKE